MVDHVPVEHGEEVPPLVVDDPPVAVDSDVDHVLQRVESDAVPSIHVGTDPTEVHSA